MAIRVDGNDVFAVYNVTKAAATCFDWSHDLQVR